MNKRTILVTSILLAVIFAGAMLTSCRSTSASATATSPSGSTSNGQTLMQERCSVCHSLDRVTSAHKTSDEWKKTVDHMISNGAQLTAQEEQTLIDYLAQTYK